MSQDELIKNQTTKEKNSEDKIIADISNEAGKSGASASADDNIAYNKDRSFGQRRSSGRGGRQGGDRGRRGGQNEIKDEFEQRIIDLARVTRVVSGGKRMSFRACVAIGNKSGKVGIGLAKGADVTMAVSKAANQARKNIVMVPIVNETIPHDILCKFGASKMILKPARSGHGAIAGGPVKVILELAGIKNISSKILGANNKVNNSFCALEALRKLELKK